jgi:signal transduction histidine kinase
VKRVPLVHTLRWLLLACYVAAVYVVVVSGLGPVVGSSGQAAVALSFAAAAVSAASVKPALRLIDRLIQRTLLHRSLTPYGVLAEVAGRLPTTDSLDQALPALARVLAEGTGAKFASVWLEVDGELVRSAEWPSVSAGVARRVSDLAALRAVPGVDHAVTVFDGGVDRGALAIGGRGRVSVTEDDEGLLRDVANSAAVLLRSVALNAELQDRVRGAEELEAELRASKERLVHARDVERRRLVTEISAVTTDSLAAIGAELTHLKDVLDTDTTAAERVLSRLRPSLDELIDCFRTVVRGIYPGVLRDEGTRTALEELASDLPRPIALRGELGERVDWEIESGIYYAAASVMRLLARVPATHPVRVHLSRDAGRLIVRIDDSGAAVPASAELRAAIVHESDRLAALGGGLRVDETSARITVTMWLPDRLEPIVAARASAVDSVAQDAGEETPEEAGAVELSPSLLDRTRKLVGEACERCAEGAAADALLKVVNRLDEPLRVAIVGRAKSGKSTLLNALVGQELAVADPVDGTTVPTWYRDGVSCKVTLYPVTGSPHQLDFAPTGAAGAVSIGDVRPEEIDRLVIDWPSPVLHGMTLIDTPGSDWATGDLLARFGDKIGIADAVVHLIGHAGARDSGLSDDAGSPAIAVGVLSRADEVGHARPDAMEAAGRIAERLRHDPRVRRLCQTVVPVAALLAASGATLREPEYLAIARLAALDDEQADRLMLSADSFAHAPEPRRPAPGERRALLDRFGMFGVRSATELVRDGCVAGRDELSSALVRRSGVERLRDLLSSRLVERADVLKARSALLAVEVVLKGFPPGESTQQHLLYELEHIRGSAHELREIDLLGTLCGEVPQLSDQDRVLAERLLGGEGADPCARLALPPGAGPERTHEAAARALEQWQRHAENPVSSRQVAEICRAVVRTCEGLLQDVTVG